MNAAIPPERSSLPSTLTYGPRVEILVSTGLAMLALGAFLPALSNGFVIFDDRLFVSENPQVLVGFTWSSLRWAWTNIIAGCWQPLTWMSYQLDAQLIGGKAWGYHLSNCLWHAANSVLFFWILRLLTGSTWRSAAAAAFFAVHPLRVESVAWIAERKDVLSTFFGLLSILAYRAYCQRPGLVYYCLVVATFTAGLLAKPMLVTLPCVFLLLDYWPLQRVRLPNGETAGVSTEQASRPVPLLILLLEKLPLLAISVLMGLVTIYAQWHGETIVSLERLSLSYRLGNAVVAWGWYLGKTFWPYDLASMYPHPQSGLSWWEVGGVCIVLLAISTFVVKRRRRQPYLLVGWLWFLGTLAPILGLIQAGDQRWADRYTYFPHLGLLVMLVWGGHDLLDCWRVPLSARVWLVAILLTVSAAATWVQTTRWHDSVTILEHTLRVTKENPPGHNHLGGALLDLGHTDKAIWHFREAIRLNPKYAKAHYNLGWALAKQGEMDEAIEEYREVVRLDPGMKAVHANLAMALLDRGRVLEALEHLKEAVRVQPDSASVHYNLALALVDIGRSPDAGPHFSEALRLSPDLITMHFPFAMILAAHGRPAEAVEHFKAALQTNPDSSRDSPTISDEPRPHLAIGPPPPILFASPSSWIR